MVSHPFPATHCLYILYFYFGKGEGGEVNQRVERQEFTKPVENTNMTVFISSLVYKLYKAPVKTTFSFGVFIVH